MVYHRTFSPMPKTFHICLDLPSPGYLFLRHQNSLLWDLWIFKVSFVTGLFLFMDLHSTTTMDGTFQVLVGFTMLTRKYRCWVSLHSYSETSLLPTGSSLFTFPSPQARDSPSWGNTAWIPRHDYPSIERTVSAAQRTLSASEAPKSVCSESIGQFRIARSRPIPSSTRIWNRIWHSGPEVKIGMEYNWWGRGNQPFPYRFGWVGDCCSGAWRHQILGCGDSSRRRRKHLHRRLSSARLGTLLYERWQQNRWFPFWGRTPAKGWHAVSDVLKSKKLNSLFSSIMPPGVLHWVLSTSNAICVGRHFYSSSTIRWSIVSIVRAFFLGGALTNEDNLRTRTLLYQLLVFWSMRMDKRDVDGEFHIHSRVHSLIYICLRCSYPVLLIRGGIFRHCLSGDICHSLPSIRSPILFQPPPQPRQWGDV